jgi:carboxymethylenebutenolidase
VSREDGGMPDADRAGSAYLVAPDDGPGPGVLVLHSWWGLTAAVKQRCDRLADAGFVALAPDLCDGGLPETAAEAELELAESDPNVTAALVLSSVVALRSQIDDPDGPISVIGYSMGASWAMWLATRQADSVRAVVIYYGTQDTDFDDLEAPVQGHFAEVDEFVSRDEQTEMFAHLKLAGRDVEFHDYPGTQHWFAEAGHPEDDLYDPIAAELAWERTVTFLSAVNARDAS